MKKLITILLILCAASTASAQNFLDELQKKQQGQGTVTVTESKEISDLVNGTAALAAKKLEEEKAKHESDLSTLKANLAEEEKLLKQNLEET